MTVPERPLDRELDQPVPRAVATSALANGASLWLGLLLRAATGWG